MAVIHSKDQSWIVTSFNGSIFGTFKTNAEAWRFHDRYRGEPTSRSEQVAEYTWRKMYHEGVSS